jgi:hypothetical protein
LHPGLLVLWLHFFFGRWLSTLALDKAELRPVPLNREPPTGPPLTDALLAPCISELLVGCGRIKDSVGGTPTEAVETTALPKKPRMSGVSGVILPTNQRCTGQGAACFFQLVFSRRLLARLLPREADGTTDWIICNCRSGEMADAQDLKIHFYLF